MNPEAVAVLIPIVAIGGFFTLMIVRSFTKVYTAKLQAERTAPGADAKHEDLVAAVEDLRRGGAGLAGRGDFTGRLLAKQNHGQKLAPPRSAGGGNPGYPEGVSVPMVHTPPP